MTINVNCPPRGLFIGRETENVARTLAVDFSAWAAEHGPGTLQVLLQRPGDATPYPVTLTVDGTVATWRPSETDLAEAGTGAVQLVYTVGEVRVKTSIIPVMVEPSLGVESDPPEGWTSWLDQLTDLAAETEQHAANAAESAEDAEDSATDAQQSATDAVAAKNAAVAAAEAAAASASHYPQIVGGVWYVWSPTAGEYISTGIDAQGEDGVSPTVEITAIQGGHRVVITDAEGSHTFDVLDGVTPDMSAYRTAAEQDEIDDAQDEEIDDLKSALNTKAGILRDTASGSVASFVPDSTVPDLLGLSVALEPIQDLHGYDSPWPAGGGKNLIDPAAVTPGKRLNNVGGEVTASAWAVSDWIPCAPNTDYYVRGSISSANGYALCFYDANKEFLRYQVISGTNPVSGVRNSGADAAFVRATVTNTNTASVAYLAQSSVVDVFSPYSNLCPISGRGSVTVNANGTTHTIPLPETVYGGDIGVVSGEGENELAAVNLSNLTWSANSTYPHTFNGDGFVSRKQMIHGSLANRCYCSRYKWYESSEVGLSDFGIALANAVSGNIYAKTRIYVSDARFSTVEEFVASFSEDDPIVVCPLATPTSLSTTPTEISTVEGENNVFSPDGNVTVEYAADLKTYIDNKIAAAVAAMS